jgi:hypothetical protein
MLLLKKCKVNSECRIFIEEWTDECLCVSVNRKALSLIFSESIAPLKEHIIVRYNILKHKEKYKKLCQCSEKEKVRDFRRGCEQQNVTRKQFSENSSLLQASYCVAHSLAKENKTFL